MGAPGLVGPVPDADLMPDELGTSIVLFASLLDERQRPLPNRECVYLSC